MFTVFISPELLKIETIVLAVELEEDVERIGVQFGGTERSTQRVLHSTRNEPDALITKIINNYFHIFIWCNNKQADQTCTLDRFRFSENGAFFVKGILISSNAHFLVPDFDHSYCSFLLWAAIIAFYSLAVPHHSVSL